MPAEVLSDFGWGPRERTFPGAGAGETGTLAREGRNPRRSRRGVVKQSVFVWSLQMPDLLCPPSGSPQTLQYVCSGTGRRLASCLRRQRSLRHSGLSGLAQMPNTLVRRKGSPHSSQRRGSAVTSSMSDLSLRGEGLAGHRGVASTLGGLFASQTSYRISGLSSVHETP